MINIQKNYHTFDVLAVDYNAVECNCSVYLEDDDGNQIEVLVDFLPNMCKNDSSLYLESVDIINIKPISGLDYFEQIRYDKSLMIKIKNSVVNEIYERFNVGDLDDWYE